MYIRVLDFSLLLFVLVLEMLLMEFRTRCPYKLLYAHVLVLMEELVKEQEEKGLKVSTVKSKVLIRSIEALKLKSCLEECRKGVFFRDTWKYWVRQKCSSIARRLRADIHFVCECCKREIIKGDY